MTVDANESRAGGRGWLRVLAMALPAAVGVAVFWAFVLPPAISDPPAGYRVTPAWDFFTYFLPKFEFGTEELLAGRLPIWNRYELAGIPFLATAQPAALYPPKLLAFATAEAGTALKLFLIGHYLALPLFFILFVREQGIGRLGVIAGSLFVTFNVPFLLSNYHPNRHANVVWIPLVLLFGNRLIRRPGLVSFALLACSVALLLTAGYPEVAFHCAVLISLYALVADRLALGRDGGPETTVDRGPTPSDRRPLWMTPPARPWTALVLLGSSFVLGAALAGAQVLPFFELLGQSHRVELVSMRHAQLAADQSQSLEFFRMVSTAAIAMPVGMPGLLGVMLAGALSRRALAPLLAVLTCVAVAAGGWAYLRMLPGLGGLRHPFAWTFTAQIFVAWLVAAAVDTLARPGSGLRGLGVRRALVGVSGIGWAVLCLAHGFADARTWNNVGSGAVMVLVRNLAAPAGTAGTLGASNLIGAAGGIALVLTALAMPRAHATRLLAASIALVVAGQIGSFPFGTRIAPLAPETNPAVATKLIPADRLADGRVLSLIDPFYGTVLTDRVESVLGVEGSLPVGRAYTAARRFGVNVAMRKFLWEDLAHSRAYLDTLDVRFVVAPTPAVPALEAAGLTDTGISQKGMHLLENDHALGRAWAVYGVENVGSPDAALDRLLSGDFDPERTAIVEVPLLGAYPERAQHPPTPADVRYLGPATVAVDVDMAAPGLLVLADSCYEGWLATVDGEPAELLCANYLVRAIELEAGSHRVEFAYRPASVRWGLALSATSAAAVLSMLFVGLRRRHHGSDAVGAGRDA